MVNSTETEQAFVSHVVELKKMADCLKNVVEEQTVLQISELLTLGAEKYGTTTERMKYALSFSTSKKILKIDYDNATVQLV